MNWDQIYVQAYREFDCQYLAADAVMARGISEKKLQRRLARQTEVMSWITKTRNLMESPNPPRTKEEAVKALSPIAAYLLWSIFKFLAIKVIEFVWDRYHEQQAMQQGPV